MSFKGSVVEVWVVTYCASSCAATVALYQQKITLQQKQSLEFFQGLSNDDMIGNNKDKV